ncbi:hypothetical protein PLCT2_00465 [Planctomycetaceae bacterium]|nr:hypothetical protein PLCT2_00465 [Planctomycetaceae bacterium]
MIEEFKLYLRGGPESRLEREKISKMVADDFGYELFAFEEDRKGDWLALKAKYNVK